MAPSVDPAVAEKVMAQVRNDVQLFDKYVAMGEVRVEDYPVLARHVFVRASVLAQLDQPEEIEDRAGDVVLEFDQFSAAVYTLVGLYGLETLDFHAAILALTREAYPVDVDAGVATVATLQSAGYLTGSDAFLRLHRTCVSYDATVVAGVEQALVNDERVASSPVYPEEFVAACSAGCVDPDTITVAQDHTGAWVLDEDGQPFLREALPDGPYALRPGSARHVSKRKFLEVIAQVYDLAGLMRLAGYCYLLAVPIAMRVAFSKALAAYPTAGELRRLLPRGGQWCSVLAKGSYVRGDYHLTSAGALPGWLPSHVRVGAGAVDEASDGMVAETELRSALRRLEGSRLSAFPSAATVASAVPRQVVGSSRFTLSVDAPRAVGFSGVNQVAVLPDASELFEVSAKHTRRDDGFVARLDSGPPISDSYYRKAENRKGVGRYLPATRSSRGRTVLLPDAEYSASATTGSWRSMDAAAGWSLSRLSLRHARMGERYDMVVSAATAARLDCNAASTLVVGGLQMPGLSTTVWFQSALRVSVGGQGGSLVMAVPRSGSATGPGWLAATAVAMYKCPFVKAHENSQIVGSNVVQLSDTTARSAWGVVRTEGYVNLRDTGVVPIHISTAGGRSGLGVFVVSGHGLRSVNVAGVVVPAVAGVVCVAIEGWETNVEFSIVAPGKYKVVADFVADPATFEEKLRPSPVTPTLPNFGFA